MDEKEKQEMIRAADLLARHFFEQEEAFARDLTPEKNRLRRLKNARERLAKLIGMGAPEPIIEKERGIVDRLTNPET